MTDSHWLSTITTPNMAKQTEPKGRTRTRETNHCIRRTIEESDEEQIGNIQVCNEQNEIHGNLLDMVWIDFRWMTRIWLDLPGIKWNGLDLTRIGSPRITEGRLGSAEIDWNWIAWNRTESDWPKWNGLDSNGLDGIWHHLTWMDCSEPQWTRL
jgi:hypothetical protein